MQEEALTKKIILIILIFNSFVSLTRSQTVNEQFEFKIENDQVFLIDEYYTGGLFFTYKKNLPKNFIFKKQDSSAIQLDITLAQQIFNPSDIDAIDVADFDRPFAGWLFSRFQIKKAKQNRTMLLGLELGVTGDPSLARVLQVAVHEFTAPDNIPTFIEQIGFRFLFNANYSYAHTFAISHNKIFELSSNAVLGTKDIFIETGAKFVFGKYNPVNNSARSGFINSFLKKELFGFVSLQHKYVAHNTLLEGRLFGDEPTFTVRPTPNVLQLKVGGVFTFKKYTIELIYNANTEENSAATAHHYGSFVISKSF